ncbi:hypothetical protein [Flavobacterium sp. 3HN19-14]|uniref:hypothetical protein n=1 Tax=Flavobacterium sp. 3HN19-14 TaxID=3448133 RepID=UPI003EE39EEC
MRKQYFLSYLSATLLFLAGCSSNDDNSSNNNSNVTAEKFNDISSNTLQTIAIKADGTLWSWGTDAFGLLGNGSAGTDTTIAPAQIMDGSWKSVHAGEYNSFAIKFDGTLWAWGVNNGGQLGIGTMEDALAPHQVGSATDWKRSIRDRDLH